MIGNDGHVSQYSIDWLSKNSYNPPLEKEEERYFGGTKFDREVYLWGSDLANELPTTPYEQVSKWIFF